MSLRKNKLNKEWITLHDHRKVTILSDEHGSKSFLGLKNIAIVFKKQKVTWSSLWMQHCQFFFNSSYEFFYNKIPINNILITTEFEHKYTKKLAKTKKKISNIIHDRSKSLYDLYAMILR